MILLCGIPSEPPLEFVKQRLDDMGEAYVIFNQRCFNDMGIEFRINRGQVDGNFHLDGVEYNLNSFHGVYLRLMDDQLLPELNGEAPNSPKRLYCRSLHDALVRWCEIAPGRVVNRIGAMGSNFSKPYQAQLIAQVGFETPETIITNDPDLVLEFRNRHKRVIYKSISGVRSIVQTLEDNDLKRLDSIRWCPTQFQEFVEGNNTRVHTIGTEVFATEIVSDATDYRYAAQQVGDTANLRAVEIPKDLAKKCITLAQALGLAFAGIDLKITPEGRVYCLEVNPCPAYSYYEANTGQQISRAVANYLAGYG